MIIFTITARNYLSLALTLGDSIKKNQNDCNFYIVVADGLEGLDLEAFSHNLVDASDFLHNELSNELAFKYNITEYCTSIKPFAFEAFIKKAAQEEIITYMDPDTCLYSEISQVFSNSDKSLFLTPHIIKCEIDYIHTYPEYKHLWEGIFNLGFCGIRNTPDGSKVLNWWKKRLIDYCYADFHDGLHTDQKWMDYAPVYFEDFLEIVKHPGCNVSHWNIDERKISGNSIQPLVNNEKLVFFHFSGFDFSESALTKHVSTEKQSYLNTQLLNDLATEYRQRVHANDYSEFIKIPYKWAVFNNGMPITPIIRRFYRACNELHHSDPFSSTSELYKQLDKKGLLDKSAAAKGNFSSKTVRSISKKEKLFETGLRFFKFIFGIKNYTYLIKAFYKFSKLENHLFLLDKNK